MREIAHVLRRVTRRRQYVHANFAKRDNIGIPHGVVFEFKSGVRTRHDPSTGQRGKLATPAEKVIVQMSLEDVADEHPLVAGDLLVLIDITQRIDQRRDTGFLGNHEVCAVTQSRFDEVPDAHGIRPLLRQHS